MDQGGGYAVNAQIKATGIDIETGVFISGINKDADGNVVSVSIADSPSEGRKHPHPARRHGGLRCRYSPQ